MPQIDDNRIVDRELINEFTQGMWRDSLLSRQPPGTYREMWGGVRVADEESSYGVSNESSNEIAINLPEGFRVRGLQYLEARDEFIVMLANEKTGEAQIGKINHKKKSYTSICETPSLGFCDSEWIHIELKIMQPCNQLHAYWSQNDIYWFLNLDDPCCNCEPQMMLRCHDVGAIELEVIGGLGNAGGLPNGSYSFSIQLFDEDGNSTNPFRLSKIVSVGQAELGDNLPGERSGKGISFSVGSLHPDFPFVRIYVHSIVDGVSATRIVDTVGHGNSQFDYTYFGDTGKETTATIEDITSRRNKYLQGKGIAQHGGRLVLYNTITQFDLDYQKMMEDVTFKWQLYMVPQEVAHRYKGLRPNEKYWFGLRPNYCDGTSARAFMGYGPEGQETCEYPADDSTTTWDSGIKVGQDDGVLTPSTIDYDPDNVNIDSELDSEGNPITRPEDEIDVDAITNNTVEEINQNFNQSGETDDEKMFCVCDLLYESLSDVIEAGNQVTTIDGEICFNDCEDFDDVTIETTGSTSGDRFIGINHKDIFELVCACEKFSLCVPNPNFDEEEYQTNADYDEERCLGHVYPFGEGGQRFVRNEEGEIETDLLGNPVLVDNPGGIINLYKKVII